MVLFFLSNLHLLLLINLLFFNIVVKLAMKVGSVGKKLTHTHKGVSEYWYYEPTRTEALYPPYVPNSSHIAYREPVSCMYRVPMQIANYMTLRGAFLWVMCKYLS